MASPSYNQFLSGKSQQARRRDSRPGLLPSKEAQLTPENLARLESEPVSTSPAKMGPGRESPR